MKLKYVSSDLAPAAIGPYSQAIITGDLMFCSGQIAIDPATGDMLTGDVSAQTEQVMRNIAAVLKAAGAGFEDVVKTTIFLVNMADFAAVNEIYGRSFCDHKPARSTVAVQGLPRGAQIEIEVIAKVRG